MIVKMLAMFVSAAVLPWGAASAQTWEQITPALSINFPRIACSADGVTLLMSGFRISIPVYLSTNSGGEWAITSAPLGTWGSLAISVDGTRFVAAGYDPRGIYTSTDRGVTWSSNNVPSAGWTSVAASADGQSLVAVNNSPQTIYLSTNGGALWTHATNAPPAIWRSVASSADGSRLIAANYFPGTIYTSSDSGSSWTLSTNAPAAPWIDVASGADGTRLFALSDEGQLYTTADSGMTWSLSGLSNTSWRDCAASGDASTVIVCSRSGFIYASTDWGTTWNSNAVPVRPWSSVAVSTDGSQLFAAADGAEGGIWRSQSTPAPRLQTALASGDIRLAWILPSKHFVLQQSPDCTPGRWEDITYTSTLNVSNLQFEVLLPLSDRRFYRLKSQ